MEELAQIIRRFSNYRVLVIGDIMLDTYFKGDATRISAEAPIPIIKVEQEFHVLGGAGNVAANIVSLGGKATIFSFIGHDYQAEIVRTLLREKEIDSVLEVAERTIHKVRLLGNNQQLARADFEVIREKRFSPEARKRLKEAAHQADIILISDYAKGTITAELMKDLTEFNHKILADPKPKNKLWFKGISLIKSNEKEALEMTGCAEVESAGKKMHEELGAHIIITRGKKGMTLFGETLITIPTSAREVFDVSGAGDTTLAALGLSLAAGASLHESALIANHAAGIKVEKAGTYAVSGAELRDRLTREDKKILDSEQAQLLIEDCKKKGEKIVTTNGSFDLLHVGHLHFLEEATKRGDVLMVLMNSDSSVRQNKGPDRPLIPEKQRAEMLAALEPVDYVVIFSDTKPLALLEKLKPHTHIKGGSWDSERMNEEKMFLTQLGCGYECLALEPGLSTTTIVNTVLDRYAHKYVNGVKH